MADERDQELKASQTPIQIREGAGLEEARYNVEFIEWLRKWSGPVLVLVAVLAGGYALRQHFGKQASAKQDAAYSEYEAARQGQSPNPDTLVAVADAYGSVGAVAILARLDAGDIYLDSVRRGIKPGAVVGEGGVLENAEDALAAADRESMLAKASEQYQWVLDRTSGKSEQAIHAISALYGLAAVAESRGDAAQAKTWYERIVVLANEHAFPRHATLATSRMNTLGTLATLTPVPSAASVPAPLDTTPKPPPAAEVPAAVTPVEVPGGGAPASNPGAAPVAAPGSASGSAPGPAPAEAPK